MERRERSRLGLTAKAVGQRIIGWISCSTQARLSLLGFHTPAPHSTRSSLVEEHMADSNQTSTSTPARHDDPHTPEESDTSGKRHPTKTSSEEAQEEQDRQLESGEENPA